MKEASHNNAASHVWSKKTSPEIYGGGARGCDKDRHSSQHAGSSCNSAKQRCTHYLRKDPGKALSTGKIHNSFSFKKEVQEKESAVIQVLSVPQLITHIAIHLLNENSLFFFKCQKYLI